MRSTTENFFCNNDTANESETLTNKKESQWSSSFSLSKEQYNSLLTLLQQSQSQLVATPNTEHHHISNTPTCIICNLQSVPKSVLWILDSGATDHISSSLENFATYRIIPDIAIKLPDGTTVFANIKSTIIFSTTFILQYTIHTRI